MVPEGGFEFQDGDGAGEAARERRDPDVLVLNFFYKLKRFGQATAAARHTDIMVPTSKSPSLFLHKKLLFLEAIFLVRLMVS